MLSSIQKLLLAFVTLILGVVLIGTIASNTNVVTEKTFAVNESHVLASCLVPYNGETVNVSTVDESNSACNVTVTNPPTAALWKVADCPLTSVAVRNATGDTATVNTDYRIFSSTGIVQLLNTTRWDNLTVNGNATYSDYTYCGDNYINTAFGRSSLNLVAGFFALALLGVSVGLFYSVAKDVGII